ncbi:FxSxx-COOH system tetratricopeptide repeat protein [Actinoplanes philippinensis]|nr:FxSxx-COOH system tetratricopeptide repeat protein [Actinoplanes philippinensis]
MRAIERYRQRTKCRNVRVAGRTWEVRSKVGDGLKRTARWSIAIGSSTALVAATWLICQLWAGLDVQTSATVAALVLPVIGGALAAWAGHSEPRGAAAAVEPSREVQDRPPLRNLPPRNPSFIGRSTHLITLAGGLEEQGSMIVQALHGLGGVGKTTLAIEYAYRYARRYDLIWWIDAELPALIGNQLASFGVAAGWIKAQLDIPSAVREVKLRLSQIDRWLVVFDNSEEPDSLHQWLPQGAGHIVITSRNPNWGMVGVPLSVDVFPRTESVALLKRLMPTLDDEDASRIADRMEDLPLAVVQAASVLNETGMTAAEYLSELAHHGSALLKDGRPPTYPKPLTEVVVTSMQRLQEVNPASVQLLEICSMMAAEPVPVRLFSASFDRILDEPLAAQLKTTLGMRRILGLVSRFGLARVDSSVIQLHRLVRLIIADLIEVKRRGSVRRYADEVLAKSCPADSKDTASWDEWDCLMPHLLATDLVATQSTALQSVACKLAWYMLERGDFERGHELAVSLYEQLRETVGPNDVRTLIAGHTLVSAQRRRAQYAESQSLALEIFKRRRRILGRNHLDTLNAADHVASNLRELGKPQEARALHADTLKRKAKLLGDEHLETLGTAHNLALDLRALGLSADSLTLNRATLLHRRTTLGCDHPHTLLSAHDVAVDLEAVGYVDEAAILCRDTLARRQRLLGGRHPATLETATLAARLDVSPPRRAALRTAVPPEGSERSSAS